jgi:DNA primase
VPHLPEELIEQVAAANDIVDVIGGYLVLKQAEAVYKAICPFHAGNTASFSVNPQRQIFKCHECGAGGSVFRFVMNIENIEFIPAVRKLAKRTGIRIVEQETGTEDLT